jgi:hypothetical protein
MATVNSFASQYPNAKKASFMANLMPKLAAIPGGLKPAEEIPSH